MKEKLYTFMIIFIVIGTFIVTLSFSLATNNTETTNNIGGTDSNDNLLIYYYDEENLNKTIVNMISRFDKYIIFNATYNYSNFLNENYDFLVNFAINYIIDNEDYYKNNIKYNYKNFEYRDIYNNIKTCDKYIDLDYIYDISNSIFGKRDFYIINNNLDVDNNLISLLMVRENDFNLEFDRMDIVNNSNNEIIANVYYKNNNFYYQYILNVLEDNRLIIRNVGVEW